MVVWDFPVTDSRANPVKAVPPRRLRVLMLLDNPCNPDWRVEKEANSLVAAGCDVRVLAWERTGAMEPHPGLGSVPVDLL
ncbi:MAG: hypothetical protein M3021_07705, partial [Actinomycetota bacterium]|nr:hypothetical protein [Actinomycetota bacterium]